MLNFGRPTRMGDERNLRVILIVGIRDLHSPQRFGIWMPYRIKVNWVYEVLQGPIQGL